MNIKDFIYYIPNFPTEGILFNDITPLLQDGKAFSYAIDELASFAKTVKADKIIGPESRGFIFGCPVANKLQIGFIPVRKPGKLPREVIEEHYELEYGQNILTMHKDAIKPGERCCIVDDLLATGGTIQATIKLIERLGGVVAGIATLIELTELDGRKYFEGYEVLSLIKN